MISKIAASFLRPGLGVRFASATLAVAIVVATLPAGVVEAAATTHIERIKGTVGFLSSMSGSQNTVETYAYVPDGDMARAGCSSMAALTFQSGASVMLGGSTVLRTPQDGKPALLASGAVAYRSNVPFTLATSLGSVSVRRGTGYVVAGKSAVEVIAVASDESDVSFSDPSGNVYKVAGGKALTQTGPTDGGRLGPAMIQDVSAVNNPAIDQFAQGRNPLGHTSVAAFDPTGSPKATCGGITRTAAGLAAGPLVALLFGGGAVAAVALGGQSGGGGNGSGGGGGGGGRSPGGTPSSGVPTTGPSGSPSSGPVGSPTPNPGGSPSSRPSGSPSSSPSGAPSSRPSGAPSGSPSGAPSGSPSGAPSGSPSGAPSGSPSGAPSGAPSGSPSGAPSASPSASAAPVYGAVTLAPNAVLVSPALGAQASSTIAVSQSGYTGGYTASVSGCVGVGTPPTATVVSTGPGTANVVVTATGTVNLNLGCQVTVTGGNGMTAIAPVTVTLAAGGTPTPSPSPTASSAASPGPVVVNPTSIVLSPAVGSAATTTVSATQVNGGPFTATVTSCVGAGTPPVAAVTNTGNGMATVTVTASGVVGAQIGCNLVITGAGMQSTTVPLTVSAVVIGPSPTPVPSPTGTGLGTLRVNPTSVLLQPSALGANASANILVGQANYTGSFGATLRCPVALNQPMVSVSGTGVAGQGVVTVTVGGPVNAAVACNVIITGGGGQSVSVPVTVAATVGVGATPTPNPNGTGPLAANPATILLNPGVATAATQNVVLSDPGYAGPYGATVTCATSGLTPILAAAFVTPTVTVSGDVVTVMSPAQPLGLSVLCTVTASSNIGQSVAIPVTVSVGVLSALDRHRRLAASSSVLFTPATVSLSAAGSAAVGSFAVSGAPGPYRVTSACLGGLGLRAIVLGNRVELEERGATALGGTCLLTVTASTGATGQIPVRTPAGAGISTLLTSEPAHRISLARTSLTLRAGEMQSIATSGSGPFTIAGCAAVVDVRSSAGALLITGRSPGVCSLTVRGSGGGSAIVTVTVVPGVSLPARMQPRR